MGHKPFLISSLGFFQCVFVLLAGLVLMLPGHAEAACQCELHVRVNPAGSGNITSPQFPTNPTRYPSVFVSSNQYRLTAVPQEGYVFVNWEVNYTTNPNNPINVSIETEGQKTVTAFFQRAEEIPNLPPTADAGQDQSVIEGELATLDGSGSVDPDDGISSYFWQQIAGVDVTLSDPSAINPGFTAPPVSSNPLTLKFRLTVEDNSGAVDIDDVTVTALEADNVPPTADAGDNQTVTQRSMVTLDASGSFDANGNDDIKTYFWEQTMGTRVPLSDNTAVKPTFRAPEISFGDTLSLEFRLTLEDALGTKAQDRVQVVVVPDAVSGGSGGSSGCFISSVVH